MLGQWEARMRDEDAYVAGEHPERSADVVVAGDPNIEYDPRREIVVRPKPQDRNLGETASE
jgi:hypothetical protein